MIRYDNNGKAFILLANSSFFYSSKILYDYKLKGKFDHKESFGGQEFVCKLAKSGNLQCILFKQPMEFDIEEEQELIQCYEDEDVTIYDIKDINELSPNSIGNVFYYSLIIKTEKDSGIVLPGLYIILFGKAFSQKIIFAKKNTIASKSKFSKLSKYLHHAQPLKHLVKLLVQKEKKLPSKKGKVIFLNDVLKFSEYLEIGSIYYAKEGISLNESFSFNRTNLYYDSIWFDFTSELENFCCLFCAWIYIQINYYQISYDEFADYHFIEDENFSIKYANDRKKNLQAKKLVIKDENIE